MRRLSASEKRATLLGLVGAVLALLLVLGSQAQAAARLYQTIPTRTPRTIPVPTSDGNSFQVGESATTRGGLILWQEMMPQDVLAGQALSIRLGVTNTLAEEIGRVLLIDHLDPGIQPQAVRATQGAARVQGRIVLVDVGTLEAGQTVLVIIDARVDPAAQDGQIILNQTTVEFEGGQASSEVVAAGLPPAELPATGRDGRTP